MSFAARPLLIQEVNLSEVYATLLYLSTVKVAVTSICVSSFDHEGLTLVS